MAASQYNGPLGGRLILIVQRTWIVARQLSAAFEAEGARVLAAHDVASALLSADAPDLAAAVLDSGSAELCRQLGQRGIPSVLYTARTQIDDDCAGAPVVKKPAPVAEVVEAIRRLL